jgi:hypothetical protein
MNAYEFIINKQIQWAHNHQIQLIGSKGIRGRAAYTTTLNQNLFRPLDPDVLKSFQEGDGNETQGNLNSPAKMQAVHSSSSLAVNIFQYWKKDVSLIAAMCGFCDKGNNISHKIVFEDKYPILERANSKSPNIDVVIYNQEGARVKRFAIECKFTEAYTSMRSNHGLKQEYIDLNSVWEDMPGLYALAKSISPNDNQFHYLHPAQLMKHILGLKRQVGEKGFRLMYLWYDALGEEGNLHRKEIEQFAELAKSDGVKFHAMSYQELISKLSTELRPEHTEYITYVTDRYL